MDGISALTCPVWKVSVVHLLCSSQSSNPWFHLIQALLLLLLDQSMSGVPLTLFGALTSAGLVLVVWIVFLVLQPQPLCLLDERTLFCFRQKPEEEKGESGQYTVIPKTIQMTIYSELSTEKTALAFFKYLLKNKILVLYLSPT